MIIIGCDLHTRSEQIAMLNTETGEVVEKRLDHAAGADACSVGSAISRSETLGSPLNAARPIAMIKHPLCGSSPL